MHEYRKQAVSDGILRQIVVYDASADFVKTEALYFGRAAEKEIEVTFPDNRLHARNVYLRGRHHGQI